MYAGVGVLANRVSVHPSKVSYTLKGWLVLFEKLHFQRNFGRNFIAVQGVCVLRFLLINRYWGIIMYGPGASS